MGLLGMTKENVVAPGGRLVKTRRKWVKRQPGVCRAISCILEIASSRYALLAMTNKSKAQ